MKIEIGRYNQLPVLQCSEWGGSKGEAWLGDAQQSVRLPGDQLPPGVREGDLIEVFVYTDSEDVPVATTLKPAAVVGEFAFLEVVDVTRHGAFLDWGLPKDLFAPFGRQHHPLQRGEKVVVGLRLHERTQRVIASSTLAGHFDDDVSGLSAGEAVSLLVYGLNERGVQVVVNGRHAGLIHHDQVYERVRVGQELSGFVAQVRDDHRLDITLQRTGHAGVRDARQVVLSALEVGDGFLPLHDKSPPADIQRRLQLSKKAFKRALGALYKARRIQIERDGVRLLES